MPAYQTIRESNREQRPDWHLYAALAASAVVMILGSLTFVAMHATAPDTAGLRTVGITTGVAGPRVGLNRATKVNPRAVPTMATKRVPNAPVERADEQAKPLNVVDKAGAAIVTTAGAFMAGPAQALVDERMNGDGTGKALGINDGILGFVILGVFTTVWAVYATAASKGAIGEADDEDYGLKL